jgi:hypothetical protein
MAVILSERSESKDLRLFFVALKNMICAKGHDFSRAGNATKNDYGLQPLRRAQAPPRREPGVSTPGKPNKIAPSLSPGTAPPPGGSAGK